MPDFVKGYHEVEENTAFLRLRGIWESWKAQKSSQPKDVLVPLVRLNIRIWASAYTEY